MQCTYFQIHVFPIPIQLFKKQFYIVKEQIYENNRHYTIKGVDSNKVEEENKGVVIKTRTGWATIWENRVSKTCWPPPQDRVPLSVCVCPYLYS